MLALLASCSGDKAPSAKPGPAPASDAAATTAGRAPTPDAAVAAAVTPPDAGSGDAGSGAAIEPVEADDGADFAAEAQLLFRVVACGNDDPVPKPLNAAIVRAHCRALKPKMKRYQDRYLAVAKPYIAAIRPADLPKVVVYPFGGGDLLSALTTFPDAEEITTISLEFAGDPRRITRLGSTEKLEESLALLNETMANLLAGDWNWSANLKLTQRGELPGQLAYSLVALAVHGQEPVSLRYFRFLPDGKIDYLNADDIAAVEKKRPKKLREAWVSPDSSEAFTNMEIRYQAAGGGPVRVFRHVAFNLDDKHLTDDPSMLAHLEAKGRVSAMTRAAAYLLWEPYFSKLRDYLTSHIEWMISDSTGLPPPFAEAAGLEQDTYGKFVEAFEPLDQVERRQYNEAFAALFKKNPYKELKFRYGYPDNKRNFHMIVTRRPSSKVSPN